MSTRCSTRIQRRSARVFSATARLRRPKSSARFGFHAAHPNDWPQSYADADLLTIIAREIAFSQYLEAECTRYHLPYFDTSRHFMRTLDEVVATLQET